MNKKFTKNKVVVITGGAKKIGRSTALKLAEQGFNILIHTGGKSIDDAKTTVKLVKEFKVQSNYVKGDLANIKTIKKYYKKNLLIRCILSKNDNCFYYFFNNLIYVENS